MDFSGTEYGGGSWDIRPMLAEIQKDETYTVVDTVVSQEGVHYPLLKVGFNFEEFVNSNRHFKRKMAKEYGLNQGSK